MKKSEKLSEAIGNIDDNMIDAAYKRSSAKDRRSGVWQIIGIAASFLFMAAFAVVLSRFATKTVNPSASSGTDTAKEQLLYEKDFTDHYEHNIKFTSDDGTLEYELKLILPADERFFFKCYAKVTNKTDGEIELHKIADHNSFFYLENILKNAKYEQTFVYNGSANTDTVKLKPDGSYEELLTYTDGVNKNMKNDYVQYVHDVSGYLTVTVNLDPSMSRTWGKSFYWFEGSYYKNNGKTIEIGEDDYGYFICEDQRVKGLEGFICDSYEDPISGQHIEADGYGISEELISMENPPTLYYKPGDKIDFINDPVQTFNGFQLWYIDRYNTLDTGDDLYEYLNANPGQYYLTAELKQGKRYTSMGVKLIVESRTDEIVFMTAAELGAVAKIHVTSLPEGYDYSFSGEEVKPITDYLVSLHPVSIDDNDGYMDGMTWVIELTYADGSVNEIYHIGNTYIHKSDGNKKYYKLTYEEASRFDTIIRDLNISENSTTIPETDAVITDEITEKFTEILKRDGYYYCVIEKQHKTYNTENAMIFNITPDDWKEKLPGVYLFSARTGYFIMVNDVIYVPFNTVGGYMIRIEPYDYNNDGTMDIRAYYEWGSGMINYSCSAFDLQTMKTVSLESISDFIISDFSIPDDFSFSITWNTYGISSYDSKTGTLIKTKDATDVSKYTTTYKMNDIELMTVYNLLMQLKDYPDNYDPYNDPDSETRLFSTPNRTVIIKFTANGAEKTITCEKISYGVTGGYDDAANKFLQIEQRIEDILTDTKQWQTLAEYEHFYE